MMTDALLQLSSAQAVTSTAVSTNVIDLLQNRDLAGGDALSAIFTVDATATAAGAATVTFQIISSAAANLSSPTVLVQSAPIPKADLVAGRQPFYIAVAPNASGSVPLGQRYLAVQYTVGTGPLTAGSFSCVLSCDPSTAKLYNAAFIAA